MNNLLIGCNEVNIQHNFNGELLVKLDGIEDIEVIVKQIIENEPDYIKDFMLDLIGEKYIKRYCELYNQKND